MGKIKTIEELRDELIKINFFNNDNTPEELYQLIKNKNDEFYEINRYKIDIEQNTDKFYKDEQKNIREKIILSLKKNFASIFLEFGEKIISGFEIGNPNSECKKIFGSVNIFFDSAEIIIEMSSLSSYAFVVKFSKPDKFLSILGTNDKAFWIL